MGSVSIPSCAYHSTEFTSTQTVSAHIKQGVLCTAQQGLGAASQPEPRPLRVNLPPRQRKPRQHPLGTEPGPGHGHPGEGGRPLWQESCLEGDGILDR